MYLIDTVVISELRKSKPHDSVARWVNSVSPRELFLSTITLSEIELGIERQRIVDPVFAGQLERWLQTTLVAYADRILPLGVTEALRWGKLAARIGNKDLDIAIAAIALEHGLTVATRNVAHFTPTGVAVFDPYTGTAYPPS